IDTELLSCFRTGVDECAKTSLASAIAEDRVRTRDAILLIPGEKTMALEFHRAGRVGPQPQVAAHIFVQCCDLAKGQSVGRRIGAKPFVNSPCVREKLGDALIGSNPNPAIAGLKKLEHPISRKAVLFVMGFAHKTRRAVRIKAKETAASGRRPKPSLMIFQKIMDRFVRQTITFRKVFSAAIGPATIKPGERSDPERAVAVFKQ